MEQNHQSGDSLSSEDDQGRGERGEGGRGADGTTGEEGRKVKPLPQREKNSSINFAGSVFSKFASIKTEPVWF